MDNIKQIGGNTGTSGNVDVLFQDIVKLVGSVVNTVVNTVELAVNVLEIPGDLGKAYDDPGAPGADIN